MLNRDDREAFGFAGSLSAAISLFSRTGPVDDGACVEGDRLILRRGGASRTVMPVPEIPLVGVHNLENVLAACVVADLCGVPPEVIAAGVRSFHGLPHRIELVAEVDSVRYYNDSKATNVAAAARSLESFAGGVVLILGGKDKGGDFAPLLPLIRAKAAALVLMGKARDTLGAALGEPVPVRKVATMAEAVSTARAIARPGQVVLLAPACASFDAYRNFEERGEDFRACVRALSSPGADSRSG